MTELTAVSVTVPVSPPPLTCQQRWYVVVVHMIFVVVLEVWFELRVAKTLNDTDPGISL